MTNATLKTKSVKTVKAAAPKAVKNTPVKKTAVKAEVKPTVFALVAGLAVKVEHKALKQAVKYHVSKGSLKLTTAGVELTAQGKTLWDAERVAKDPAKFQEIAAFVKGTGECPKEWKGQPTTTVADGVKFPNMLYWGSFTTGIMRQAFSALWAK